MAEIKNDHAAATLAKTEFGLRNLFWGSVVSLTSVSGIQLEGEGLETVQLTLNVLASLGMAWGVWGLLQITKAHSGTSLGPYLLCVLIIVVLYMADFVFVSVINGPYPPAMQNRPFLLAARVLDILRYASYISFCACMLDLVQVHGLGDPIWRNWLYTLFAVVAVAAVELITHFLSIPGRFVAVLVWLFVSAIAIAFYLGSLRLTFKKLQDLLDGESTTAI